MLAYELVLITLLLGGEAQQPATTPDEISSAIQQLDDERFAVRNSASKFLWEAGSAAKTALEDASISRNPEVARRARSILKSLRRGIHADTPRQIADLLHRYWDDRNPHNKLEILRTISRQDTAGVIALARLIEAEEDDMGRQLVSGVLASSLPDIAAVLLANGKHAEVEQLLEAGLKGGDERSQQNYVMWHVLLGKPEEKIRELEQAEATSRTTDGLLVLFYLAIGKERQAWELAKAKGCHVLHVAFQIGEWKRFVDSGLDDWDLGKPPQQAPNVDGAAMESPDVEQFAFQAAYHRLAGNPAKAHRALRNLQELLRPDTDHNEQASENLLINEEPAAAIAVLTEDRKYGAAFEILTERLEYSEAFKLFELANDSSDRVSLDINAARLLAELGQRKEAKQLFDQQAARMKNAKEPLDYGGLIDAEYQAGYVDEAFVHCAWLLTRLDGAPGSSWLLDEAFPNERGLADILWQILDDGQAPGDASTNLKRLRQFFESPPAESQSVRLLETAIQVARQRSPEQKESDDWIVALARYCEDAGLVDLASRCHLVSPGEYTSLAALVATGDFHARNQRWREAAEQYAVASQRKPSAAVPLFLHGWALERAGQKLKGKQLQQRAILSPLANPERRFELAQALESRGLLDDADNQCRLISLLCDFEDAGSNDALRLRSDLATKRKDFFLAASCMERGTLYSLREDVVAFEIQQRLIVQADIHHWRARGHLSQGNVEQALREAELALRLLPGDIYVPINLVPVLDRMERTGEADALFAQVFGRYEQVCVDYPQSAYHHNIAAWLAARCRRRLDEAMQHARIAVELSGARPDYLDTLAEIHFQRGETNEAIDLARRSIAAKPAAAYYRAQLTRFLAGDPSAETPEAEPQKPSAAY